MKPPGHRTSRRRGHRRAREVASVGLLLLLAVAAVPLGLVANSAAFWTVDSGVYGAAGAALVAVALRSLGLDPPLPGRHRRRPRRRR